MATWNVHANYDPEARVWYVIDGDVPGLAVDAATLEELEVKVANMLDDLLDIHREDFLDKDRLSPPHAIRLIAFHERLFPVAA
jgi:hypothetical protein